MPPVLNYPGVYIEELPSGVRTITGVATSIAAFVGYTRQGTPNRATTITSFADFERGWGGLDRDSPVSYAVRQFFANGGTQAIVVRVATGFATSGWTLDDDSAGAVLDLAAASPGAWGNALRITVDRSGVRNPDSDFNLVVNQLQSDGTSLVTLETLRNLTLDSRSPQFVESVLAGSSTRISAKRRAGLVYAAGFAVSKAIGFPLAAGVAADLSLGGTVDGKTAFHITIAGIPPDLATLVTDVNNALTAAGLAAVVVASQSLPDGSAGGTCLKLTSMTAGESSAVQMGAGGFGGLAAAIGMGLANGGREFTGAAPRRPATIANAVPSITGVDGNRGSANDLIGSASAKSGLYALLDTDLFNLLAIPETFDLSDDDAAAVYAQAVALCQSRRAFYLVDAPSGRGGGDATVSTSVANWVANKLSRSRNAAIYYPAPRLPDPLDSLRPRSFAPSGTLAGVYARTDATRGVWKAPAGTEASLNGVVDLAAPLNDAENGIINPLAVNALRFFPAYGRVAWGARTLSGSDALADEYKYVPVRRLALFIEESLYRGTQWVVFEPNDEPLWAQIRLNVGAFMNNLFRQGAFQGASPRQAYFVKCDHETTTQNDIDLGVVNIAVGFAPLKPAEFVVIQLQQIAGQVQA
ncbi:MAG: phage tail sheath subtilisin-like domain-containing protein [Burkholderiales bacterium]|nr:phage tail sheath subtilisin-like domain-containing protein [Burkholderiales bacterium]